MKPDDQTNKARESFQKGNINFDLLQPEDLEKKDQAGLDLERDKRGIFFRQKDLRSLKPLHIWLWCTLLIISAMTSVFIFFLGKSFIWLLILPVLILLFLWSFIMLILIMVRPR